MPTGTLRIASFNIQVFGAAKLAKPAVMNVLADVVRQFDVVAIQEVRAKTDDILPRFVDLINSTGRHYDFVIGPRLGRSNSKEQYAFIFDTASVEVDRSALYTVCRSRRPACTASRWWPGFASAARHPIRPSPSR